MCQRASNKRGGIPLHVSAAAAAALPDCLCSIWKKQKIKQSESFPLNGPPTQSLSAGFLWHHCRWETWRRGSEARWSGTQQGPEFRISSNCGCEEEEVLTFHWSIFTHLSLGSYAHSHTDTDSISHLPSPVAHGHNWRFFLFLNQFKGKMYFSANVSLGLEQQQLDVFWWPTL